MRRALEILLFCSVFLVGCEDIDHPADTKPPNPTHVEPVQHTCAVDHRFEKTDVYPITLRADIALDTCTGNLCRTWNWTAKQSGTVWSTYEDLPLCSSLHNSVQ